MTIGRTNQGQHIQREKPNPWKTAGKIAIGVILGMSCLAVGVFIGVGHGG